MFGVNGNLTWEPRCLSFFLMFPESWSTRPEEGAPCPEPGSLPLVGEEILCVETTEK